MHATQGLKVNPVLESLLRLFSFSIRQYMIVDNLKHSKNMSHITFQTIDWKNITKTEHPGETGKALWQTANFDKLRIRIVEYSEGYLADHWCQKGHIVHCLKGEFKSELQNGETFHLSEGMTYVVSDNLSSHRSITEKPVTLLIIDGDFLQLTK